jgi:hypothetical protein
MCYVPLSRKVFDVVCQGYGLFSQCKIVVAYEHKGR